MVVFTSFRDKKIVKELTASEARELKLHGLYWLVLEEHGTYFLVLTPSQLAKIAPRDESDRSRITWG